LRSASISGGVDITAEPEITALADPRDVEIDVKFSRAVAILVIKPSQLATKYALPDDVPIVGAIEADDA